MIDKEPFRAYSDEEEIEQRKKDKGSPGHTGTI